MTRYQILEHPTEHGQAKDAVAHHRMLFDHPPNLVAGDRGVHSAETEPQLTAAVEARVSLACGHRGEDCQLATRLWLAQKQLSRARRDGAVVGPGSHRQ